MPDANVDWLIVPVNGTRDVLTEVLRTGAQRLVAGAIEAEVAEWIDGHRDLRDESGRRQAVRGTPGRS
jgi:putative transposase